MKVDWAEFEEKHVKCKVEATDTDFSSDLEQLEVTSEYLSNEEELSSETLR